MEISEKKIKEILVEPGYVNKEDFETAKKKAEEKKTSIYNVLIGEGVISDSEFGQVMANHLKFPFIELRKEAISKQVIETVPRLVAKNQKIIVFDKTREGLKVALADPTNIEMIDWLERKTGEKIAPYFATENDIEDALKHYRKELKKAFEDIIAKEAEKAEKEKARAEDVPVIKIVDTLIEYAYENRASDIHIEPLKEETQIRFRIDGVLHNVLSLPKTIHGLIVTRIKVLAELRTDEHFAAQDGKFNVKKNNKEFDIRVSIVPVTEGENIVMRLLTERARGFSLEELGLLGEDLKRVRAAIKNPYGMILSTGPTGCGKTTTLYAVLKILNTPKVNIATIEDPVEYDIQGVSQIQVNPRTNLTFAEGLRSIVRQDPDVIMVGEIRDEETADIAVNSATTGHLVLSTMHANTAATNLVRLIEMGIEPFLVSSSVNVVIAQRLVRKICLKCRESYEVTGNDFKKSGLSDNLIEKFLDNKEKVRVYRGRGCKSCNNTGYTGRTGIFEVLEMEDNIKKLVMEKANSDQIQEKAVKNGMTPMIENGIKKVLFGQTTIEEIIRVTRE